VVWGLDYVVVRYAKVYGPRQDPRGEAGVISIFTDAMLEGRRPSVFGGGEATRDYIHVADVVRANLAAMSAPSLRAYNVGTGVETSVRQLYDTLASIIGFREEPIYEDPRPGEIARTTLDASRLTTDAGWRPQFDLEAGLRDTVAFFRQAREA